MSALTRSVCCEQPLNAGGLRQSRSDGGLRNETRPNFGGRPRRRPTCQRSRERDWNARSREQFKKFIKELKCRQLAGEFSELDLAEKVREADARYRLKRLEEATSRRTSTDERVVSLKRAIKQFVKAQAGDPQRGLRRAFSAADVDHSGELDYDEFKEAVRNFGLKHLSAGALRTLFDSFDVDGSGSISHAEFMRSIGKTSLCESGTHEWQRGPQGPLTKPSVLEPHRVGFEVTPAALDIGELYVSVIYEATLSVLNVGDTDLRFCVSLEGFDMARDKNPVRVVERPSGPLAPGLRSRFYFEVFARAPGVLDLDVVVSCGDQECVVPLSGTLVRRESTAIPSTARLCQQLEDNKKSDSDSTMNARVLETCRGRRLPKYVRRITLPDLRRVPRALAAPTRGVWPSLSEQWEHVQMQTSEAGRLLSALPALQGCPSADIKTLAVRLRRVSNRPATKLYTSAAASKQQQRILFVATGTADVLSTARRLSGHTGLSNEGRNLAELLGVDVDDHAADDSSSQQSEEECVASLRAPFYVGEGSVLLLPHEPEPEFSVVAATKCDGFSIDGDEAAVLVARRNKALAMIRRELLQRRFERDCAEHGGLIRCNYRDAAFVDALLQYAETETRHEAKARFLCRQLLLTDQCNTELNLLDDILSGANKTDDQIRTERTLAFDRCLVASDKIWTDFLGDDSRETGRLSKTRGANILGPNLVNQARLDQMLSTRRQALAGTQFDNLYRIYKPLERQVTALLDRTVLPDFTASKQYKTWLDDKFPLDKIFLDESTPSVNLSVSSPPSTDSHRSSIIYDLPDLRKAIPRSTNNIGVYLHADSTLPQRQRSLHAPFARVTRRAQPTPH